MNQKIRNQIVARVSAIEGGTFTNDDLRLLFIDLRAILPMAARNDAQISTLYDIFDLAAHPNRRDRGRTFNASKGIIDQFLKSISQGGSVQVNLLNLNVATSLCAALDALQIPCDQASLKAKEGRLKLEVYHLLDGVEIAIIDDRGDSASIFYDAGQERALVSFKMKPFNNTIGNLTISGSPTMRFPII
jgi:hypothetical protein